MERLGEFSSFYDQPSSPYDDHDCVPGYISHLCLSSGKGSKVERLKLNCPDYKKPYKDCQIYKKLEERGHANLNNVIQLGDEYNIHFREEIRNNSMPLFKRVQKRNFGVAIWFFEQIYSKIFNWLVETDKISL